MKRKKLLFFLVFIILLIIIGLTYLNSVVLPTRIKSLIVNTLQEKTHATITLGKVRFDIFKGLVLSDLELYNGQKLIANIKELSCTLLVWPVFQKKIIIPVIRVDTPVMFLERKTNGTFNISDLFLARSIEKPEITKKSTGSSADKKNAGFGFFVRKIEVVNGQLNFEDKTFVEPFAKKMENLDMALYLTLPAMLKFSLQSEISGQPAIKLKANGKYNLIEKEFSTDIFVKDLAPKDFSGYYKNLGINIKEGFVNSSINLLFKNDKVAVNLKAQSNALSIQSQKLSAQLNLDAVLKVQYNLADKTSEFQGNAKFIDSSLFGMDFIGDISHINSEILFDNTGVSSDKARANIMGKPIEAKIRLLDFNKPQVNLELAFEGVELNSDLIISDKIIKVIRCNGHYLNSKFAVAADIDTSTAPDLGLNIGGGIDINLEDLGNTPLNFQAQLAQIKPLGQVHAKFTLHGHTKDLKSSIVEASLSSQKISLYGLSLEDFFMNATQQDGLIDIPVMRLSVYEGRIDASAKLNIASNNLPYWIDATMQGVKIEKLKLDTTVKDKDISGTIQAQCKINGFANDFSRTNGDGSININDGRLWQLNLFKGLGVLLFAKDFSSIVFHRGSCSFVIQDKYIFSDDLKLESNITNLSGSAKIGFDSSIDSAINVEVLDELVPLSGTFKSIIAITSLYFNRRKR